VAVQRLGLQVEVRAVEMDAACRRLTMQRFPEEDQTVTTVQQALLCPVAELKLVDLLVGGFPCQDVSSANKAGQGLAGRRSGLFFDVLELVRRVRLGNGDFVLECTDFSGNHTAHFRLVGELLGFSPVILCASDISPGRRKRAFWTSFPVAVLRQVLVEASSVLEPGRRALKAVLPTVMASGTKSWNTAEVVVDAGGNRGPLLTVEMERQMGLEEGFTDIPGVTEAQRHHQIGNAFHAGIMEHVLQSWVDYAVAERRLDRQRGFPVADKRLVAWGYRGVRVGQARVPGPKKEADDTTKWLAAMRGGRQQARRARSKRVLNTCGQATAGKQRCVAAVAQRKVEQKVSALKLGVKAATSARSARWRQLIPEVKQQVVAGSQSIMQRVGGYESWGSAKRSLITDRQARNNTMSLDSSLGFRELAG
jgi:hypothetical protein